MRVAGHTGGRVGLRIPLISIPQDFESFPRGHYRMRKLRSCGMCEKG